MLVRLACPPPLAGSGRRAVAVCSEVSAARRTKRMQVQLQFPQVISKVIASGPRLRVKSRMIGSGFDVTRALENGEIDLVIGGPNPGPQLLIEYLYERRSCA